MNKARFLFFLLLLAYPLLAFLWRRSYPLLTSEVAMLFAALVAAALLLAALLRQVRPGVAGALSALLVTLVFTLQFNLFLVGILVCAGVSFALAWWLRDGFHKYGSVVLAALLLGAWLDGREQGTSIPDDAVAPTGNAPPPVVHILLDGFIGPAGMPNYPATDAFRERLDGFLRHFGFQSFPRAYSRHGKTVATMYSSLNFRHDGYIQYGLERAARMRHALKENAYFDQLGALDYQARIYQTEFLDYCDAGAARVESCWNYPQPNVNTAVRAPHLADRIAMVASVWLSQSTVLANVVPVARWRNRLGIAIHDPRVLATLQEDLLATPRGRIFFAHVLLPHHPFVFRPDCTIDYTTEPWERWAAHRADQRDAERFHELRYALYVEQADCALVSLAALFNAMREAGVYEDSLIVLHGDHGSRITNLSPHRDNQARMRGADWRANYSILFAARLPGTDYGVDDRMLPLPLLLQSFAEAVTRRVEKNESTPSLVDTGAGEQEDTGAYIYMEGAYPLHRVDIDIFED